MASSTINEPFVLSSYSSSSSRGKKAQKYTPGVYASAYQSQKANGSDGYVTVAVQADGVHVLDVSTLHPVISHTLGPSTSFSCPPLSCPSSSNASTTYAVIASSPELSSQEESGRTLWVWRHETPASTQKTKESKVILSEGQTAYGLYSCAELPDRIVLLSTNGELALVQADSLEVKSSRGAQKGNVLFAKFVAAEATSLSSKSNGAVMVLVESGSAKKTQLRVLTIDEADSISEQESEIPIESDKISSVSCSNAGTLGVLTTDGSWHSYNLTSNLPSTLNQTSPPLHLSGLSFLSENSRLSVSTLALSSSHVLLASVAAHEVILLLWDLQFSVLLASHSISIPATLSSSTLHIGLLPGSETHTTKSAAAQVIVGQAILILSSVPGKDADSGDQKSHSVVLVVPYVVPTTSTVAAAMGKGEAGKKWLRAQEESKNLTAEEQVRGKLLASMRTAMQGGRPQAAVAAFMKWAPKPEEEATAKTLDYNFVKEVLNISLLTASAEGKAAPATAAYSPEVVRYLLEKRLICSTMVSAPGGLLGALRLRDDWTSIELAFENVLDISEAEIVDTLLTVVRRHRSTKSVAAAAPKADDAMDVDTPAAAGNTNSSVTALPVFLNLMATYPTSHGPLLLALRKYLKDAEDVTVILQVLDGWVVKKMHEEAKLLPTKKDLKKTEQGVWVVVGRKSDKKKKVDVPSLEKIVNLLQIILDASFLSLLQHPPAHKLLRKLQNQLNPEITFGAVVETLRGPLEPFAIAQEKTVKESLIPAQERERERQKGDWRQRRKNVNGGADIGLYKLEELVL
ncbi:hypothetical protein D9613_004793 [Agrocybe pediades]|uniref:Uncharacterized protein n=1 Tax=Agrocybe pediades TaxID=84607 RepID=A0A8H4QZC3_9AGAR|nr:hypothetical protein D9613_004793 [Agrocybe pediades]